VLDYGDYDEYEYEGAISEVDDDADDEAGEGERRDKVKLPAIGEFFPQVEGKPYPDSARRGKLACHCSLAHLL